MKLTFSYGLALAREDHMPEMGTQVGYQTPRSVSKDLAKFFLLKSETYGLSFGN